MGELQGEFRLNSPFEPAGDQPEAIEALVEGFKTKSQQVLMGVTGSGKTFTMANVIQRMQKPTLVISHNKDVGCTAFIPNSRNSFRIIQCTIR